MTATVAGPVRAGLGGGLRAGPLGRAPLWCHNSLMETVVVVDDDSGFRALVGELLRLSGFAVIGHASDGHHAVAVARRLRPDIVLLDIQLPGADGFWVAGQLLADAVPPLVVLMSGRSPEDYGDSLQGCRGVAGFLAKADLTGTMLRQLVLTPP